jgi:hypothetical protein
VSTVNQPRGLFSGIAYSQWAYWCTLAMAAWAAIYLPIGSARAVIIVTPVLPAILIVAVSYWMYAASDEYFRVRLLKSAVVTMIAVGLCTLAYFFLELFGYPKLSMLWVNLLEMSIFNLQMLYLISRA